MTDHERALVQGQMKYVCVAFIFGAGAYFLFGGVGRAVLLFFAVGACLMLNMARRWILRGGVLFLGLIFLVIFNVIPPPAAWSNGIHGISVQFCDKPATLPQAPSSGTTGR